MDELRKTVTAEEMAHAREALKPKPKAKKGPPKKEKEKEKSAAVDMQH
jgi:hypothetical protein